jgi:hypothetical protein
LIFGTSAKENWFPSPERGGQKAKSAKCKRAIREDKRRGLKRPESRSEDKESGTGW